jgi:hypothetical protein
MRISRRMRGALLVLMFAFAFAFSAASTVASDAPYCNWDIYCPPLQEWMLGHKYAPGVGCEFDVMNCGDCFVP